MRIVSDTTNARIRKIVVYAVYIILLTSLQVSFPEAFTALGQTADITFVFVVLAGYFNGFWDGAIVGFICGMIRDVFSPPAVLGLDGEVRVTAFIGVFTLFSAGIIGASFFTRRMRRNIFNGGNNFHHLRAFDGFGLFVPPAAPFEYSGGDTFDIPFEISGSCILQR